MHNVYIIILVREMNHTKEENKMEYTLTLTEEQMMMIRHAMCDKAMKYLTKAFEVEEELKALGRTDKEAVEWEMKSREECHGIISIIDNVMGR